MKYPTAYLLTWTCYGTWLHGDERGSVDDENNDYGWPVVAPDPEYLARSAAALKHPAVNLDWPMRRVVEATIVAHCKYRGWELHAQNVRTNHVHVVAGGIVIEPGAAEGQLKAWSTRRLREASLIRPKQEVWTKRGSKRYLWTPKDVRAAMSYVLDGQGVDL